MTRQRVTDDDGAIYEFTPAFDPIAEVEPGAELTIRTRDSLDGAVQSDSDLIETIPEEVNAATGPIAVEGSTPGDVLRVEIEAIRLDEPAGRVVTIDGFGLQDGEPGIEAPRSRITPAGDGSLSFEGIDVPVEPVIGTIGVAPREESYTTLVPHDHGGNLDTTDMSAGSVAYFPVFQEGAGLAMGDCKAAMADGEMCGTGSEVATETLEAACKLANRDAFELLAAEHDLDTTEAYMFSSLVGGLEISQVVDPLVTVRNAIPAEYLSEPF